MGGSFADHHPLIGARLAVAWNDIPAVEAWIRRAIARGIIDPARGGEVALILFRYGARQPAHDVVSHLMRQAAPKGMAVFGIVAIAARVGLEETAGRWLREAQKRSNVARWTPVADLFLKEDVSDEALAAALSILKAGDGEKAILRRLRDVAVVTGHLSMSQAVLRRLLTLLPKEKEDLILSEAYALRDKPLEALAVLAPYRGTTIQIDKEYAEVLVRAVRAKKNVKSAVFRFLPDWVARDEVPAKTRRIIIYDLIAAGKAHWVVAAVAPQSGSRLSIGNQYSYALTEAVRAKHDVRKRGCRLSAQLARPRGYPLQAATDRLRRPRCTR